MWEKWKIKWEEKSSHTDVMECWLVLVNLNLIKKILKNFPKFYQAVSI